jgi:hypothetical protein
LNANIAGCPTETAAADHTPDHGHTKILRQSPMTIDAIASEQRVA